MTGLYKFSWVLLHCCVLSLLLFRAHGDGSEISLSFAEAPNSTSRLNSATFSFDVWAGGKLISLGGNGAPCTGSNVNCSCLASNITCKLDDGITTDCGGKQVSYTGLQDGKHKFEVCSVASPAVRCSSYNWTVDTVPPTAYITSPSSFTNAMNVSVNISFTEPCIGEDGKDGFKCSSENACNLLIHGYGQVVPSSLVTLVPTRKYNLLVNLSSMVEFGTVKLEMDNNFCADTAGNKFVKAENSTFNISFDRRTVLANLISAVPQKIIPMESGNMSVLATNNNEDLKVYLNFSAPVLNSSTQVLNSLHTSQGTLAPITGENTDNRTFGFKIENVPSAAVINVSFDSKSIITRLGNPVSPIETVTFEYDSERPEVRLRTTSRRTRQDNIPVLIEFSKPVLRFNGFSDIKISGGYLDRPSFKEKKRGTMYYFLIQANDSDVSVDVPENVTEDVFGNKNQAAVAPLEVWHYSGRLLSRVTSTIVTSTFGLTCLAHGMLAVSSASLLSTGSIPGGSSSLVSDPASNFFLSLSHIQLIALSRWLPVNLPVEYYEYAKALEWSIPYFNLPWEKERVPRVHGEVIATENSSPSDGKMIATTDLSDIDPCLDFTEEQEGEKSPKSGFVIVKSLGGRRPPASTIPSESARAGRSQYYECQEGKGWKDFKRSMMWLAVIGGSLVLLHALLILIVKITLHQPQTGYEGHGDSRLAQEQTEPREQKDLGQPQEQTEPQKQKALRQPREQTEPQEQKDLRQPQEQKALRQPEELTEPQKQKDLREPQDQTEPQKQKVLREPQEQMEPQQQKDLRQPQEQMEPQKQKDLREPQEQTDPQKEKDLREPQEQTEPEKQKDLRQPQKQTEPQEQKDLRQPQEQKALRQPEEQTEPQKQKDLREPQEQTEPQKQKDLMEPQPQEQMEPKKQKDLRRPREQTEPREQKDLRDLQEQMEPQKQKDLREPQEQTEPQKEKDLGEPQKQQDLRQPRKQTEPQKHEDLRQSQEQRELREQQEQAEPQEQIGLRQPQEKRDYGVLTFPRFEIFCIILALPCICKASAGLIAGGIKSQEKSKDVLVDKSAVAVGGLLLGVVGLVLLSSFILLLVGVTLGMLFLYDEEYQESQQAQENLKCDLRMFRHVTLGPKVKGKWTWKDQSKRVYLRILGPLFEDLRGLRNHAANETNDEEARAPTDNPHKYGDFIQKLCSILRTYYILLESVRQVILGILAGAYSNNEYSKSPPIIILSITCFLLFFLVLLKPFVSRRGRVVEMIAIVCEAGVFTLTLVPLAKRCSTKEMTKIANCMVLLPFVGYLAAMINQFYALYLQIKDLDKGPNKSFVGGLKTAYLGVRRLFLSQVNGKSGRQLSADRSCENCFFFCGRNGISTTTDEKPSQPTKSSSSSIKQGSGGPNDPSSTTGNPCKPPPSEFGR